MSDPRSVRDRVFRKASLERLSSPEQLDLLIQVTSPRAWIALAALWLGLGSLLVWSVLGRVSTRVEAEGILLGGQVQDVIPAFGGQVISLGASVGDDVTSGQVLATLDQPELAIQIENQRARIRELEDEHAYVVRVTQRDLEIQRRFYAQQRANLEQAVAEQEEVFRQLSERAEGDRRLLEQGIISRADWLASQQSLNSAREQLERARNDLTQLNSTELNAEFQAQQAITQGEMAVRDARRTLAEMENNFRLRSTVRSPYAGKVVEVAVGVGDVLAAGQAMMKIRVSERERGLRAILYVEGADGKRVEQGMDIQIVPSTIRPEEYGYMLGTVSRVTELPTTSQAMQQALRNDQLVASLSSLTAPFQVDAELIADPDTPSGYRWTSVPGPDLEIGGGTPARALIVVERRRPIELVVPAIRRMFQLF